MLLSVYCPVCSPPRSQTLPACKCMLWQVAYYYSSMGNRTRRKHYDQIAALAFGYTLRLKGSWERKPKPRFKARFTVGPSVSIVPLGQQFFQVPNMVRNACFHRRCDAQCLVRAAEVVIREVQAIGRPQVVPLL